MRRVTPYEVLGDAPYLASPPPSMSTSISIQARSQSFAIRVVKAYVELNKQPFDDAGKVLSKQFLRARRSIGANCAEAKFAQSNKDFISKYSIALQEASECRYWIRILVSSGVIAEQQFTPMLDELNCIIRILIATIKQLKKKE
ncbi:four helix bundle protein [Leptothoe sp. ISB3NOV94-8A]